MAVALMSIGRVLPVVVVPVRVREIARAVADQAPAEVIDLTSIDRMLEAVVPEPVVPEPVVPKPAGQVQAVETDPTSVAAIAPEPVDRVRAVPVGPVLVEIDQARQNALPPRT